VEFCEQRLAAPAAAPQQRVFPTALVIRDTAPLTAHELRDQVFATPPAERGAAE
jgi:hypothetical protein